MQRESRLVPFDLSLNSPLKWQLPEGDQLFLELELGLEKLSPFSLMDSGVLASFLFAAGCFNREVLGKIPSGRVLGLIFHRICSLENFSEELFSLLVALLPAFPDEPDEITPYLFVEGPDTLEAYPFFKSIKALKPFSVIASSPLLEKYPGALDLIEWKEGRFLSPGAAHPTAILLPESETPLFDRALKRIDEPFRVLTTDELATSMSGLERVIAFKKTLSPRAERLLLGFEAASGEIIYIN